MSVRLRVKNGSQELVVSSEGRLPYCIGRAKFQKVVPPVGRLPSAEPGRTAGYSVYHVYHPGPILVAFDLPIGRHVGITNVSSPSSGVWEIEAYCGANPDEYGFDTQYPLDIWAFGFAESRAAPLGLVLHDAETGIISADFTRDIPLFPRAFGDIYASKAGIAIPPLQRPVGIGMPGYVAMLETTMRWSIYTMVHVDVFSYWYRVSETLIEKRNRTVQRYMVDSEFPSKMILDGPGPLFIIEGVNLP